MENKFFCSNCGAEMRGDMNFCPKCGTVVAGSETEKQRMEEMNAMARESGFMWVKFLLIIYAIPVVIAGIVMLVNADANTNLIWNDANFQKWLTEMKYNWDWNYVHSLFVGAGSVALVSGLGATVALVCVYMRKFWVVAFIACIVSTIFSVWIFFIGIFVGIFVTWMIYDLKQFFEPMGQKSDSEPKA